MHDVQVATGPQGIVDGITAGKGYVDMSTVDAGTAQAISKAVEAKGGKFLEVIWRATTNWEARCTAWW